MGASMRPWRRKAQKHTWVLPLVVVWSCLATWSLMCFLPQVTGQGPRTSATTRPQARSPGKVARGAAVHEKVKNPVKTVSETIADFYKAYPQPPVLPMYRNFVVDLLTQLHLAVVDSRFKYDAIFALGVKTSFSSLMGNYDKLVASEQSEKIWSAMITALGLKPDTVTSDAEAVSAFASKTAPADILKQMEGDATEAKVGDAFSSIKSGLYSASFSVGLFTMMELSGVELTKANVEEWAKALSITPSKVTSDFETYKQNKSKLQKAEEMIREVEIREKKKLAERLEAKAKALAEKAAKSTKPTEATDAAA